MFLPTTRKEMKTLGWEQADIIFVSGDVYIDSYYDGTALLGKILMKQGFKVAIIAQPDVHSNSDITRLGEPKLFWGVTGGCVDSMVANYTALKKKKHSDDLTPGGLNTKRPDRAVIKYTNLIKQYFKHSVPVIIGGVEASLRRIAHYDYWDDAVRRSVLFDSKADILVYGMAEKTIVDLAITLRKKEDFRQIRGICYISGVTPQNYSLLPSYEEVKTDKMKFVAMFNEFYQNNDPLNATGLVQKHGDRYLVQNPPAYNMTSNEIDEVYDLEFERDVHPFYKIGGKVKALETIKFSINSHRGCFGECNFCSITVHQGRTVISRSENSILNEVKRITKFKDFKGNISDIGGPTADMWAMSCIKQQTKGSCKLKRCTSPEICNVMKIDHTPQTELLKKIRLIKGVKKVFIGSGIRYDLVLADKKGGGNYLGEIVANHVSGQLKIAPEHTENKVLNLMGKPSQKSISDFRSKFIELSEKAGKKQFLTYYFIAAHPGCDTVEMKNLNKYIKKELKLNPEQVQVFTPTPSTYSTLMYYTGINPFTGEKIFVEKNLKNKSDQKEIITGTKTNKFRF